MSRNGNEGVTELLLTWREGDGGAARRGDVSIERAEELIRLDDALDAFARIDARKAKAPPRRAEP